MANGFGIGSISAHNVHPKKELEGAEAAGAHLAQQVPPPYTTLANGQPNCVFDVKDPRLT